MISVEDIKTILYKDVKAHPVLGLILEISKDVHSPVKEGEVHERVVIIVPGGVDNEQIARAYPRVCFYVPDREYVTGKGAKYYKPDGIRLGGIGSECTNSFRSITYGKLGEDVYTYVLDTVTQESDPETWSSFLNVRLKFEIVNTKL
jgi:hypothetical protein